MYARLVPASYLETVFYGNFPVVCKNVIPHHDFQGQTMMPKQCSMLSGPDTMCHSETNEIRMDWHLKNDFRLCNHSMGGNAFL
jgi:hypothetical protein